VKAAWKNSKIVALFCILELLILSCQRQHSPQFDGATGRSALELKRLEECKKSNVIQNVFEKENFKSLFGCLGWDEQFPAIYHAISSAEGSKWNHVFQPINTEIWNNKDIRNRILSRLKLLDKKGALDDLGRVITALNDTNFFDAINELFTCAENEQTCTRQSKRLSKYEILKLLEVVDIKADTLNKLNYVFRAFIASLAPDANNLASQVRKFYQSEEFQKYRIELLSIAVFKYLHEGLSVKDKLFIKLLLEAKTNDDKPVIFNWINNSNVNDQIFRKIVTFPAKEEMKLVRDFKAVEILNKENLSCGPGESTSFELSEYISRTLDKLVNAPYMEFYSWLAEGTNLLVVSNEICPTLKKGFTREIPIYTFVDGKVTRDNIFHSIDLLKFEKFFIEFLIEKPIYEIAKIFTEIPINKFPPDLKDPNYLISVFGGDALNSAIEITKILEDKSPEMLSVVLRILKRLPGESYTTGAELYNQLERNEEIINKFAKLWDFYNFNEKNFLFYYLDRHFDADNDYLELLTFYSDIIEIIAPLVPKVSDYWLGNNLNSTYDSIKQFSSLIAGPEILKELKRFLSRDYMLKFIEILARGVDLSQGRLAVEPSYHLPDTNKEQRISLAQENIPLSIFSCVEKMKEINVDLYFILSNEIKECSETNQVSVAGEIISKLRIENLAFTRIDDSNIVYPVLSQSSLFDSRGLLSPNILSSGFVNMKIVDKSYVSGSGDEASGLGGWLVKIRHYLYDLKIKNFENRFVNIVDNLNTSISAILRKEFRRSQLTRNILIRKFANHFRTDDTNATLGNLGTILREFGTFLKGKKTEPEHKRTQPEEFKCETALRKDIGADPCPSRAAVKRVALDTINLLLRHNGNSKSGLWYLLKGLNPGEGLVVPLGAKNGKGENYNLSIKETMQMMYEMTNKQLTKTIDGKNVKINALPVLYREQGNDSSKKIKKNLTTAERIEVVVRDVRFDNNYLGAHYKNAVAKTDDYNYMVKNKMDLFKLCVGLGFCGKFFSKDERRMGRNAVDSFPSLLEANTVFGHGKYMQTLLQIVVGSSSQAAQKSKIIKFGKFEVPFLQTKQQLLEHNGKIVTNMAMLSVFSNGGRIIRDRVGISLDNNENVENMDKFFKSSKLNFINKSLLDGVEIGNCDSGDNKGCSILRKILLNLVQVKSETGKSVLDSAIDWVADLNYDEVQKLENSLGNLIVIMGHIGPPSAVRRRLGLTNEASNNKIEMEYAENGQKDLLLLVSKLLQFAPKMEKYLPSAFSLKSTLFEINEFMGFMAGKLLAAKGVVDNNPYYLVLNDLVLGLHEMLSDDLPLQIESLLSLILDDAELAKELNQGVFNLGKAYVAIKEENGAGQNFVSAGEFMIKLANEPGFNLSPILEYLEMTTHEQVMLNATGELPPGSLLQTRQYYNWHYDEPASIINHLSKPSDKLDGSSKLLDLISYIFDTKMDQITRLIKDLLPVISISHN